MTEEMENTVWEKVLLGDDCPTTLWFSCLVVTLHCVVEMNISKQVSVLVQLGIFGNS